MHDMEWLWPYKDSYMILVVKGGDIRAFATLKGSTDIVFTDLGDGVAEVDTANGETGDASLCLLNFAVVKPGAGVAFTDLGDGVLRLDLVGTGGGS